jgi:Tfp pilus assembly protein PilE
MKKLGRRGLSLVETVITVGIMLLTVDIAYNVYVTNFDMWDVGNEQAELQYQARSALNRMTAELRNTTRTSTQTPSPNISIPSTPNNKSIQFTLPEEDMGGGVSVVNDEIDWDTNTNIQYQYVPGQKELRRSVGGTHLVLASNVSDVQFIDTGIDGSLLRDELKIVLTLQKTIRGGKVITATAQGIVKLRN